MILALLVLQENKVLRVSKVSKETKVILDLLVQMVLTLFLLQPQQHQQKVTLGLTLQMVSSMFTTTLTG